MAKTAIHGRCPLCNKAYEDPLLTSHRCNPVKNKIDLNDSGAFEAPEQTWNERLEYGVYLQSLAGDDIEE